MRMPRFAPAILLAAVLAAPSWALVQAQAQSATPAVPASTPAKTLRASPARVAAGPATPIAPVAPAVTKPVWQELTPPQQQALAPLAGAWNTLSEAHKRKWLALSVNFPKLSTAEQAMLRSRMTEWAAMSPQQRTQARLNFGETKRMSPDDKKAKWEAYQALPAEEKRKLATDAAVKPPTTAAAVKPVPKQKLATVPSPLRDTKTPRIAIGPQTESGSPALPAGAAPAPALQTN